jgi:hypothetical protein
VENPKKREGYRSAIVVDPEQQQRHRVDLLLVERAQIRRAAAQHRQRREVEQPAEDLDSASSQLECRGEHRTRPAHRFQQLVEQHHRCDLARHFQQVKRESEPVQGLIGQDVGGGFRGVTKHDKAFADKSLGEDAGDYVKEIDRTGEPSLRTRRHVCDAID